MWDVLELLLSLGNLWDERGHSDEALILYLQGMLRYVAKYVRDDV